MKTKQGSYYDQYKNTSDYYVNGNCVATLNHDSDVFEAFEDMTEQQEESYYKDMIIDKQEFEQFKSYEDA